MTWETSTDVHAFLAAAGDFLRAAPIDNTVLLTEAAYLAARPGSTTDQLYGWWQPATGDVAGAFLRAPGHPPILSLMAGEALESIVDELAAASAVGVDGRLADSVVAAWRHGSGIELRERSRIRLYRLGDLRPPPLPAGRARVATAADRELLVSWFGRLMAAFPDDPSELAYVVDDPLSYGGIVLWERAGTPKAMAGRSRQVAGMVRLSAVYAPDDPADGDAAFVAACIAAKELARDVLVLAQAADTATAASHRQLGFEPVLDRIMLAAR
ncbi:hypothetical protein Rhe02_12210 [Rhizocola hellebori]|uniref:GNAT family N-acetyltransferase n=1 Tax=Rhizocola hellebori TaxID=1392758 RepID=A0A8J3Q492_9ACTN|nr:hypothetical protein [Rhizocola hellebori]GIH03154.1 hypothetical protein Rhe02_12210 [Rhizocola hellebori]